MHLRVIAQDFARYPRRRLVVAAAGREDCAHGFDVRVVRLHLRAEFEFGFGVVESALVDEDLRAVVADDDSLRRVDLDHAVVGFERVVVACVEARECGRDELHAHVVRRFAAKALDLTPRLLLLAVREQYEEHVQTRFEQVGPERERALERGLGLRVVLLPAVTLDDAVGVSAAQGAPGEREIFVQLDGAPEVCD